MNTDLSAKAPACLGLAKLSRREVLEAHLQMLARIEQALERLADGTYGQCEDCGQDIAIERLDADPAEALCAICDMD